jgi:ribokinase
MPGEGLGKDLEPEMAEELYGNDEETVVAIGDFIIDQLVLSAELPDGLEGEEWYPGPGESVMVDELPYELEEHVADAFPGGRSPNQVTASALSGADATYLGRVGHDDDMVGEMASAGVDLGYVEEAGVRNPRCYVFLEDDGENRLACFKESGDLLDTEYIDAQYETILDADYLLVNNGESREALEHLFSRLEEEDERPTVFFDPAPADGVGDMIAYESVDYVTPNEVEHEQLEPYFDGSDADIIRTSADGAALEDEYFAEAPDVDPIDTTAAGDTFNGYLAGGLAQGMEIEEAMDYAVHAASLSVTREGARPSIPTYDEVEAMMEG